MSLLKRIERARPAAEGEATPAVPAAPAPADGGSQPPTTTPGGTPTPPPASAASRFAGAMPARESFR